MEPKVKVVLLTSNHLRHKYLAKAISEELELALVVSETKPGKIQDTSHLNAEEAIFIQEHFAKREKSEQRFFGRYQEFPSEVEILKISSGEVNKPTVLDAIKKVNPNYIVLLGSSIVKNELLEEYKNRIINLHLGLSPYYKGSATNLFPYYYKEPECVGATVHLAISKVDEGSVLHQLRPKISENDDLHSIGNKVIWEAGKALPKVLKLYSEGKIQPKKQTSEGKICRNKNLTPEVLRQIYANFHEGMISDYLEKKAERDSEKPVIKGF